MNSRRIVPIDSDDDNTIVQLSRYPTKVYPANQQGLEVDDWTPLLNDETDLEEMDLRPNPNAYKRKGLIIPTSSVSDVDDISDDEPLLVPQLLTNTTGANKRQKVSEKKTRENYMRWLVTWNNPDKDGAWVEEQLKKHPDVKGYAFQKEVGEQGTPHFQIYVEFSKQVYHTGVRTAVGHNGIATFKCNGSKAQNIAYCTKDEGRLEGPWKWGTCNDNSKGQGKRTDLDIVCKLALEAGGITNDMRDEYGSTIAKYGKGIQANVTAIKYNRAKQTKFEMIKARAAARRPDGTLPTEFRLQPRKLILMFGPSGVGKTERAQEYAVNEFEELAFEKEGKSKWWDMYEDEKVIIVDEWRKELTGDMQTFNDITNSGPKLVEAKGGMIQMIAEVMIFTSNWHPMDIFRTEWKNGGYRAVMRRFAEIHWWNDDEELTILKNPGLKPSEEEELIEWSINSKKWIHFWRKLDRPLVEGDNIEALNKYFTW